MVDEMPKIREMLSREVQTARELSSLAHREVQGQERKLVNSQFKSLKRSLKRHSKDIPKALESIPMTKTLPKEEVRVIPRQEVVLKETTKKIRNTKTDFADIEKDTLKRLLKKEKKIEKKKEMKASSYVKTANKLFSNISINLLRKGRFRKLKVDLIRANMQILPKSYVSVIFLTTMLSIFIGLFAFLFFLFFNIGARLPIITMVQGGVLNRLVKVIWILIGVPIATFAFMYFYPSLEKRSLGNKINQELPFATIHMSSISGSMIDPSKIFEIIVTTGEYVYIRKEFVKLLNEMNVFGHDLVTSLRRQAFNSPSRKLSDLFNGLATTITSGGDLPEFFDKRASSLLFDYRLEREKYTKTAETFMDIYISVVIAAPMILMLLLMMMRVSGLGISLSVPMITLIMIAGVSVINVIFLVFLQLKQPTG
jgi:flagellar protein FlaJ